MTRPPHQHHDEMYLVVKQWCPIVQYIDDDRSSEKSTQLTLTVEEEEEERTTTTTTTTSSMIGDDVDVDVSGRNSFFMPHEYVTHVSAGECHSLFVTNFRRVFSCGSNSSGGCGLPEKFSIVKQLTLLRELSNLREIVETRCGNIHSFFIGENFDSVYATGYNTHGECGVDSQLKNIYGFKKMEHIGGSKLKIVAPGAYHTVFVTRNNCVYTSGYCAFGSLGQGSHGTLSNTPVLVDNELLQGKERVRDAESGQWHSIVILEDGRAYSWGYNHHGQCGINSTTPNNVLSPVLVTGVPHHERIVSARCGNCFTIFRTESNNFYACGENSSAALGLPPVYIMSNVSQISFPFSSPVLDYSCGDTFSMFTTVDGRSFTAGSLYVPVYIPTCCVFMCLFFCRLSKGAFLLTLWLLYPCCQ